MDMKNAIILCSGGIDSVVSAFYAVKKLKYKKTTILFFDYNQRTLKQERNASLMCSKYLNSEFIEIKLDFLSKISGSFINSKKQAKKIRKSDLKDTKKESIKWYVPCRNTIFITYAMALAESRYLKNKEQSDIIVGFKCEGKEHYPDTTKEFVDSMNNLKNISAKFTGRLIAPLIDKDKEDIIALGEKLGVDFKKTFSCYAGTNGNMHCGTCLSCRLRQEGFYWANIKDPTKYFRKMKDYRKV
jgi:7-cyano-7-deazaguanine synthase